MVLMENSSERICPCMFLNMDAEIEVRLSSKFVIMDAAKESRHLENEVAIGNSEAKGEGVAIL